jgi:hypothetical protein
MPMNSPFSRHRARVLGHYSTASWLRQAVMAMWSGTAHPVGLSKLTNLDSEHFAAFIDMASHYRKVGENDPALDALVKEIEARNEAERDASMRAERFDAWCREAARELRRLGKPEGLVDDRYNWFETRFDAGDTPAAAAASSQPLPALDD